MNDKTRTEPAPGEPDARAVETYLRDNPDFFHGRDDLVQHLSVPHAGTGAAVSLIERQLTLLREENRTCRRQLNELMEVARDNERLLGRLQRLTLRLLHPAGAGELMAALADSLRTDFLADGACLYLLGVDLPGWGGDGEFFHKRVNPADSGAELPRLLRGGTPICGNLREDQLCELFGEAAGRILSVVLLPLRVGGNALGGLAIGSHDGARFQADMGTAYLDHLSELIAHRLAPLTLKASPQIA